MAVAYILQNMLTWSFQVFVLQRMATKICKKIKTKGGKTAVLLIKPFVW